MPRLHAGSGREHRSATLRKGPAATAPPVPPPPTCQRAPRPTRRRPLLPCDPPEPGLEQFGTRPLETQGDAQPHHQRGLQQGAGPIAPGGGVAAEHVFPNCLELGPSASLAGRLGPCMLPPAGASWAGGQVAVWSYYQATVTIGERGDVEATERQAGRRVSSSFIIIIFIINARRPRPPPPAACPPATPPARPPRRSRPPRQAAAAGRGRR